MQKKAPTFYLKFGENSGLDNYANGIHVNGKNIYSIHQIVTLLAHNSL